jgi:TusA-related sulfurtransferase
MKYRTQWSEKKKSEGINIGEPTITIKGQKINIKEWINENNTDCEIYETLEKYGIINVRKIDDAEIKKIASEIGNMNLMEAMEKMKEGERIWINLPLETRKEFNNDVEEFITRGNDWIKEKEKKWNKQQEEEKKKINDNKKEQQKKKVKEENENE